MDSIMPMGALPMRRLSRLYNDTKKSSDFVKDPPQYSEADPEIKSLHRKLRIQKDRLVSWGLEWSDPNQSSAEILIDSSLSKAGLSEVVGSIMSTIKDILAEAEPLWHSSRRLAGERVDPEQPPKKGEKIQLVVWDKNRFEDLVRDLTTSIDTLYDLSRTRSSYAQSSAAARERLSKPSPSAEDLRPFGSSRIQTPRQIDPATLTSLQAIQAVPMTERAEGERIRDVVFMERQAFNDLTQSMGARQPHAPLLLEYATFDSIYSLTGISPPMDRFGKLSSGLQAESTRGSTSWTGLPRLLGYFEDMDNSRFGLVYQFPKTFNPVTFEHLTQNPLYNLCSLADLLARPDFEPKLEAKFRLAANLANTVFDMHARGITHSNLVDGNISFCNAVGTDPEVSGITQGEVDIRRPLVSSFDLFTDPQSSDERTFSLYRHPLDPRNSSQSPLMSNADSKTFDLYSLSMILLSVGLWTKLENLVSDPASPVIPESVFEQLAIRCGTLYMKAVQSCFNAVDQEMTGTHSVEQIVSRVEFKVSRYLEACCIIDGVSNLDERLGDDLGEVRVQPSRLSTASAASVAGPSKEGKSEKSANTEKTSSEPAAPQTEAQMTDPVEAPAKKSCAKMRSYPFLKLSPDVVDQWHTVVMPQVNGALKSFYRKHPESVEVSLTSIGESPKTAKPTVLVQCTSVGKVRAILKKKLPTLFDVGTGFGLKVCHGQVIRSRHHQAARSMAKTNEDDEEITAANPDYQERPLNGASIGAYIGDRHLPPVSFGGLIVVDDKAYGMTVHHMLDDPDQGAQASRTTLDVSRSMASPPGLPDLHAWYAEQYQNAESDPDSSSSEDYSCEFSDSDSDSYSESAITSDQSDSEDEEEEGDFSEPGDIPGVEPGCGDDYIITQPALDDVPDDFYPSAETRDEDHIDTYGLGEMYASSGIRRRTINGLLHEIDWALFEFKEERKPDTNCITRAEPVRSGGKRGKKKSPRCSTSTVQPTIVASSRDLPGLEVQCMARTSGLQAGQILQTVASVKIYGRTSPSQIYQVSGVPTKGTPVSRSSERTGPKRGLPMGIPGDSGAWVIERNDGRVCGHILAWSGRNRVAYICPMDVLLLDIAETLEATEIRLPGGEIVVSNDFHQKRMSGVAGTTFRGGSQRSRKGGEGHKEEEGLGVWQASRGERSNDVDDEVNDGDEDSYDEGVDIDLAHDLKELQLSGQGLPLDRRGLGVS